jgi:hypothetical protein
LRAQQAAEAEARQKQAAEQAAKVRSEIERNGPKKYNLDPLHLLCEGSYNGGKRLDLDIIPRDGKAVISYPDGTNRELLISNVAVGGRRVVTAYGNIVPERFIMAVNFLGSIHYVDDGWPNIRFYAGAGAENQYSCNYYRQSLGD